MAVNRSGEPRRSRPRRGREGPPLPGPRVDAGEALRIGLLAEVTEPGALGDRVDEVLDTLLAAAPMSLELTRRAMRLALEPAVTPVIRGRFRVSRRRRWRPSHR
ncbi:hypothetical protein [Actinomadura mexicana]|uniref:hypothetical protein n=1 Tax=Actinomadura mexicana TaxID=134959 RepID=UPI0011788444|nr:hypothetical protein [Actinomadura mexicana]